MAIYSISYPNSGEVTITASGLAGDTNASGIATGRIATFLDNTSTLAIDYTLSGSFTFTTTTSTTARQCEIWIAPTTNSTATTFAANVNATDSAQSFTPTQIKSLLKLGTVISLASATGSRYDWQIPSVAQVCGGVCPQKFNIWVGHNNSAPFSTGTTATGFKMRWVSVAYTSA